MAVCSESPSCPPDTEPRYLFSAEEAFFSSDRLSICFFDLFLILRFTLLHPFPGLYLYCSSVYTCLERAFFRCDLRGPFKQATVSLKCCWVCVAAVSPATSSYNETLSTLRYAAHAKNIVNKPRVNEVSGLLFDGEN